MLWLRSHAKRELDEARQQREHIAERLAEVESVLWMRGIRPQDATVPAGLAAAIDAGERTATVSTDDGREVIAVLGDEPADRAEVWQAIRSTRAS